MKRIISVIIVLFFAVNNIFAEEPAKISPDERSEGISERQDKKNYAAEYWLFGSVPAIVIAWGIGAWGWGSAAKWQFKNDGWGLEQDSYTGGADKWGHTWGIYAISRTGSYAFEKSGDTRVRAAVKGFIFGQFMGLGIEAGDGFGKTYGFAWGDMVWNLGGGLVGLALDLYPQLDELIGFQMEYWPSKDHINQSKAKWIEVTSDVTGQKFIFGLKFSGVPYIKNTFLQYFQLDSGYYTRGYWFSNSAYNYKTRHVYIGFAFNLSRVSEKFIPEGSWRNGASVFFKYYHAPIAYNPDILDNELANKTPGKKK